MSRRWKKQKKKLLSLGSNQKPSGCLDLAVITAERATNCATEDIRADTLLDGEHRKCWIYITCVKIMSTALAGLQERGAKSARQKRRQHNLQHNQHETHAIKLEEIDGTRFNLQYSLSALSQISHFTSRIPTNNSLLIGLGTMLASLRAHLLVQHLRLVHPRCRDTVSLDYLVQADLAGDLAHTLSVSRSSTD
jgi:hypothetical protein